MRGKFLGVLWLDIALELWRSLWYDSADFDRLSMTEMIPSFNEYGYLPPGIHSATLDEIEARFGHESELRRVQMESLRWLVGVAQRAGVKRLIVNGSFATDVFDPNDVDCVLLVGADFPRDAEGEAELIAGLPFLQIDVVKQADFDVMVETIFSTDRRFRRKGMLEVIAWN